MNIIKLREKVTTLTNKLSSCIGRVGSGNYDNFPQFNVVSNGKYRYPLSLKYESICRCPSSPSTDTFSQERFLFHRLGCRTYYIFNLRSTDDNGGMKKDPVEMKASRKIKMDFHSMQLDTFWCTQLNAFPQLAKAALKVLVPFATNYLSQSGFSTLLHLKIKARNLSEPDEDMRVDISKSLAAAWSLTKNNKRAIGLW